MSEEPIIIEAELLAEDLGEVAEPAAETTTEAGTVTCDRFDEPECAEAGVVKHVPAGTGLPVSCGGCGGELDWQPEPAG